MELIHGDCLLHMREMDDKSVDMTFTSPPFKDEDVDGDYWRVYADWMKEILRVTKNVVVIIHSATKINKIVADYPPKRVMVWGKGISQYSWRWNPIFVYQLSDEYKVNKYIWCDCFGVEAVTGMWKVHKYQDPLLLYETVIGMFKDCGSVFDPFMGSGTTGLAAVSLGLSFIGCEQDREMYEIAKNKIEAAKNKTANTFGLPLFGV